MFRFVRGSSNDAKGFTLIEIMLVVVILGAMLAVVVPRALRANIDTKYNLTRQMAAELGKWGLTWAERNLEAQSEDDTCNLDDYVATLLGWTGQGTTDNNWAGTANDPGCYDTPSDTPNTVEQIMPPENQPRNPFNNASYFISSNDGAVSYAPGQLSLQRVVVAGTPNINHYYFLFLGTDSNGAADWHAGMGTASLNELRNGVFMARLAD